MGEQAPLPRPIKLAIAAVGGQGGGVLAAWLVDVAERQDHLVQSTSVPGVAQRTGATIYYLEFLPREAAGANEPVFALYPVPGDVDVVVATELVEAGRVILRGFVSPDKTDLIVSTHRDYTIQEKLAMGDGRVPGAQILEIAGRSAKRLICFDMAAEADRTGSVISSVVLGAIAGAGVLPFPRQSYEETIRAGGRAVEANLAGFAAGYAAAANTGGAIDPAAVPAEARPKSAVPQNIPVALRPLLAKIETLFPSSCRSVIVEGLRRVIDYQDPRYGQLYLGRLERIAELDSKHGGDARHYELTSEVGRYLALWMSYEDTIRVADLKTRRSRFERFRREVRAEPDQLVHVTEFMHPRVEEICDTLPAAIGSYIMDSSRLRGVIGWLMSRPWFVNTSKLSGFLMLYSTASLRRWRPYSLRFEREQASIDRWLERISLTLPHSYALALEITECARLIKGYGDTHARGLRSYKSILKALDRMPQNEETARVARMLRKAALADEQGKALSEALNQLQNELRAESVH